MGVLASLSEEALRKPPSFYQIYIVWSGKADENYVFPEGATLEEVKVEYDFLVENMDPSLVVNITVYKVPSKEVIFTHSF